MTTPPFHIACAPAPHFSERDNKKNASNVIESFLYLHGADKTVTNRNGKTLPGEIRDEVVGIVLCINPAEILYGNIGLSGFLYIISRVTANECLTFIFQFLRDIPMVVQQEAEGETQNFDAR